MAFDVGAGGVVRDGVSEATSFPAIDLPNIAIVFGGCVDMEEIIDGETDSERREQEKKAENKVILMMCHDAIPFLMGYALL